MEKYERLKAALPKRIAIAFSGGVDSTFLAFAAKDAGCDVLAITVVTSLLSGAEVDKAQALARELGIRLHIAATDILALPEVAANTRERCYFCKKALFSHIREVAAKEDRVLCDGTNADDVNDYRPGMRAVRELSVQSPLMESGLTKSEIRALSKEFGVRTHDHPSLCCLATRIPYGTPLTEEKLRVIEEAEKALGELGFSELRVRHHGDVARVELPKERIGEAASRADEITDALAPFFTHIALDLRGYRTGSMLL